MPRKSITRADTTVDDVVRMAIEDVFPKQTIPDRDNFLPDGRQFKAPDHAILEGKVLIERKSRNTVDNSQFYYKLQEIAEDQGRPFFGFGTHNFGQIIKTLPDPEDASRKMVDFMLNQTMKSIRNAKRKFEEHARHAGDNGELRMLFISDNSEMAGSNASDEHFIGRKMGAYSEREDETGLIDAIVMIKNPAFVFDEQNSYWYKCLIKRRLDPSNSEIVNRVASALHHRISHYGPYRSDFLNIRRERYRPLIV